MPMPDSAEPTSRRRVAMWCLVGWCVTVGAVIAVGLTHGVQISTFFAPAVAGRISLWQSLIFSLSMSAFGFWMALTTKPRRIPQDPARIAYNLQMYAKGSAWIFAIGGIIVSLRIIGLLANE